MFVGGTAVSVAVGSGGSVASISATTLPIPVDGVSFFLHPTMPMTKMNSRLNIMNERVRE